MNYQIQVKPLGLLYTTGKPNHRSWSKDFLAFLPEDVRQEYNCMTCRSWYEVYGGDVLVSWENGQRVVRSAYFAPEQCPDPLFEEAFRNLERLAVAGKINSVRMAEAGPNGAITNTFGRPEAGGFTHFHAVVPPVCTSTSVAIHYVNQIKEVMSYYARLRDPRQRELTAAFVAAIDYAKVDETHKAKARKVIGAIVDFIAEYPKSTVDNALLTKDLSTIASIAHFRASAIGRVFHDYVLGGMSLDHVMSEWARTTDPAFYKRAVREAEERELAAFGKLVASYPGCLDYGSADVSELPYIYTFKMPEPPKAPTAVTAEEFILSGGRTQPQGVMEVDRDGPRPIAVADFVEKVLRKAVSLEILATAGDGERGGSRHPKVGFVVRVLRYDPQGRAEPGRNARVTDVPYGSHVNLQAAPLDLYLDTSRSWVPVHGIMANPFNAVKDKIQKDYFWIMAGIEAETLPPLFADSYVGEFYQHRRAMETAMNATKIHLEAGNACAFQAGRHGFTMRVTDASGIRSYYVLTPSSLESIDRAVTILTAPKVAEADDCGPYCKDSPDPSDGTLEVGVPDLI